MNIALEQLARQLESELGVDAVAADPTELASHNVDGIEPVLVCSPREPEQVAAAIRTCAEADATLIPWGGGTAMALGNPPRRAEVILSTVRLNRLIDHDHANLTVTAGSGLVLSALQTALLSHTQFVAIDPPYPDRSTIGGIVAANLNGPRRSYYGSVRDLVIGMKVVLGSGAQIKAGGKVVKNVAGYDMSKLFIGSLGTLGIITELTVRVSPIPEQSATALGLGTLQQVLQLAENLAPSKLLPSAVVLRNDPGGQNWQLAVCFEGFQQSVQRQLRDLELMAQTFGIPMEPHRGQDEIQIWQPIQDFPLQSDRVIYRVTVPRASVAKVLEAAQGSRFAALNAAVSADLSTGTIWIATTPTKTAAVDFASLIAWAEQERGHAVLFRAPPELKAGVAVWGPSPPTLSLMREIKQQFDPKGTLNLGRFVGGL
jgi:glycolate oxidase FAD binding subunit